MPPVPYDRRFVNYRGAILPQENRKNRRRRCNHLTKHILREALLSEVEKADVALARAIAAGNASLDGATLTINLEQAIPQPQLQQVRDPCRSFRH